MVHQRSARLDDRNSVFQAELFAILNVLKWVETHPSNSIHIYSDSLSSLQAIFAHRTKYPLILHIKVRFRKLLDRVSLDHVAAHKGMFGNELADALRRKQLRNLQLTPTSQRSNHLSRGP